MTSVSAGIRSPRQEFISADEVWMDGWRGKSLLRIDGASLVWVSSLSGSSHTPENHVRGTILGGFVDSHVHLGLVDPRGLVDGGIAHVVDLGGNPEDLLSMQQASRADPTAASIDFAGAFLTARGGYPSDRDWAPPGSVREVSTAVESADAIAEMSGYGVTLIKIALDASAGPVWSDSLLTTIVAQAHTAGFSVVAHVEGHGQTERAIGAGVDCLAHTPWTESLSDDVIRDLASRVSICSTLDIHGFGDYGDAYSVACDNLARFSANGGRVLYGTDLGNGDQPVGINARELSALSYSGLSFGAIVRALVSAPRSYSERITWLPSLPPSDPEAASSWLSGATVLRVSDLKETLT